MLRTLLLLLAVMQGIALADTPPPNVVGLKGGTDNTKIGNVADALKVSVVGGGGSSTVNQGTGGLSPWLMHFDNTAIGVTQSTSPWTVAGTVAATQSGTWNFGRTWSLSSGSDSVDIGNFPASQTVNGTVTANIGTTNGIALDATVANVQGSSTGGTAASKSSLSGGIYNSSAPTLTTGQQASLQLDVNGQLKTAGSTTISGTPNVNVVNTPTVTANAGTGTFLVDGSAHTQPISASSLPLPTGASTSALQATGNTSLASIDSKLTSPLSVAQSGAWTLGRTWSLSSGTDSVAAAQSGSWSLTNISGTISLPTGAATSANQTNGSQITQVSVLPSIPAGANTIGAVTQASGPWTQNLTQIGGSSISLGQAAAATSVPVVTQLDSAPATQNVTVQDTASTTTSVANSQSFVTGSATASSTASFSVSSFEAVEVQVTGTWTGTLQSEVSMDGGTTWLLRGVKQSGASYIANSFTANFQGGLSIAGMTNFRIRATAAMTGTATVKITETIHPGSIIVSNPQILRDGTTQSVTNTIKAASTPPAATDTAIVVAVSPNSSSPGRGVLSTFTHSYSSSNLSTSAFTTIISSTSSTVNVTDIFDNSGGIWYLAYAATCGALSNGTNAVIIGPGGGGKDLQIPSGNCVGFEALGSNITSGNVYMTFYK